jgi:hypothetical protein
MLAIAETVTAKKAVHHAGTWKNRIDKQALVTTSGNTRKMRYKLRTNSKPPRAAHTYAMEEVTTLFSVS